MAKYLLQGAYSIEGHKGLLKSGGSQRREAITKVVQSIGGRLETFYWTFGSDDYILIVEVPDNITAAALGLTVAASGGVHGLRTTVLLTAEEVDRATKVSVPYRPPGQ